ELAIRSRSRLSRPWKIGTRWRRSMGPFATRAILSSHAYLMKVTVVGCSPAWPNPGGAQSGYLVEGSARLLLDCGPGVLPRLRAANGWPAVDAIAITHFHLDHWGDLVPWVFGAAYGPGRKTTPPELWLPPGGDERIRTFGARLAFADQLDRVFTIREYADGETFTTAGFTVTPVRLAHYE